MAKSNLLQPKRLLLSPFCDRGFKPIYFQDIQLIVSKYEDKLYSLDPLTWENVAMNSLPVNYKPKYFLLLSFDKSSFLVCLDIEGNLFNCLNSSFIRTLPVGLTVTAASSFSHYLIMGLSNHSIAVFDVKLNKLTNQNLSCGHGSRITFLHSHLNILFAFSDDGLLSCWHDFHFSKSYKIPSSSISSIFGIDSRTYLITSLDNSLILLDIESSVFKVLSFQCHIVGFIKYSDGNLNIIGSNGHIFDSTFEKIDDIKMEVSQALIMDDSNIFISDSRGTFHRFSYNIQKQQLSRDGYVIPTDYFDLPDSYLSLSKSQMFLACNNFVTVHSMGDDISRIGLSLAGHFHEVLYLTSIGNSLLVSGSKGGEICFWDVNEYRLVYRYTSVDFEDVSTITSAIHGDMPLLAIGSESGFIKLLKIAIQPEFQVTEMWVSRYHQKDVNYITYSNSKGYFISVSQDKSMNVISRDGKILSHLKHHKRGVWSVDFSRVFIASASADKTISILNEEFKVIHTITGHESAVTKVKFLNSNLLVSGDADGVIKMWKISKTVEELGSSDAILGKIWSIFPYDGGILAVDSYGCIQLLSFTSDNIKLSLHIFSTEEDKLRIFIQNCEYSRALEIAIGLEKPETASNIIEKMSLEPNFSENVFLALPKQYVELLYSWAKNWITNSRKNIIGQLVLKGLLGRSEDRLLKDIQTFSCYTSRALNRVDDLLSSSYSYKVIIDNK